MVVKTFLNVEFLTQKSLQDISNTREGKYLNIQMYTQTHTQIISALHIPKITKHMRTPLQQMYSRGPLKYSNNGLSLKEHFFVKFSPCQSWLFPSSIMLPFHVKQSFQQKTLLSLYLISSLPVLFSPVHLSLAFLFIFLFL